MTLNFNFRVYHRILTSAGNTIQSPFGPAGTQRATESAAQLAARTAFNGSPPSGWSSVQSSTTQSTLATAAATTTTACTGLGYTFHSVFVASLSWIYSPNQAMSPNHQYQARRRHPWSARCQ